MVGDNEMENDSTDKTDRILTMYSRLLNGEVLNKATLASEFQVDTRTIQRDIDSLRYFFANSQIISGESSEVIYDRKEKGFRLESGNKKMTASQLLAVCKILLESRAFTKKELDLLTCKLLDNCAGTSDRKMVESLIANERHHYCELQHHKDLIDQVWELGNAVSHQQYISVTYKKMSQDELVERLLKPVGITFSEFYFYLIAFIELEDDDEPYNSPAFYRVDRIQSYEVLERNFSVPYAERFEMGEFRKRIQFMYGGKLRKVKFKYSGMDIDAVLDRLPTARVMSEENGVYTVSAEVFGNGIDMWLRSQGKYISIE